jgi:hypothetical protein
MRLSDAIALGRTLVMPRGGEEYYADRSGCARGMALEAISKRTHKSMSNEETVNMKVSYPCGCFTPKSIVGNPIVHLFDKHVQSDKDWTLDQLIDWVRSVEPVETVAAIETTESEYACT